MRIVLSFDTSGSLLNRKAIPTPQSSDWPAGALVSWHCLVSFLLILFCLFVSSGHCLVPSGICHSIQAHPPPDSPAGHLGHVHRVLFSTQRLLSAKPFLTHQVECLPPLFPSSVFVTFMWHLHQPISPAPPPPMGPGVSEIGFHALVQETARPMVVVKWM